MTAVVGWKTKIRFFGNGPTFWIPSTHYYYYTRVRPLISVESLHSGRQSGTLASVLFLLACPEEPPKILSQLVVTGVYDKTAVVNATE